MLFCGEKMEEDEIKEVLIQQDEAFCQLYQQHQEIEQALLKLKGKGLLTASEELAEKELKKKKLKLKDEIYRRIVIYKEKVESHE
jgi:uncharacterized protein YdcH (DUF465 family)